MQKAILRFEFSYHCQTIQVQARMVGRDRVYVLYFEDRREPLILTLAKANGGGTFWTSVPEGRQDEADVFGPLIDAQKPTDVKSPVKSVPVAKALSLFD